MKGPSYFSRAFTVIDLLIVLATLGLMGILLPFLARPRCYGGARINCISNLKQIGLSMRMFSNDHNDKFPWLVSTNEGGSLEYKTSTQAFRHFAAVSNEINSPRVLVCREDRQKQRLTDWTNFSNLNLSYFAGFDADEGKPNTILSGDRSLLIDNTNFQGLVTATTNSTINIARGIHTEGINIGLGDGSAQQMTVDALRIQIRKKNQMPLRFVIP
jgi:hypothetical protein